MNDHEKHLYQWKNYSASVFVKIDPKDGCDLKTHPPFKYRPYRKGRMRCKVCGGKRSLMSVIEDHIYDRQQLIQQPPLFKQ